MRRWPYGIFPHCKTKIRIKWVVENYLGHGSIESIYTNIIHICPLRKCEPYSSVCSNEIFSSLCKLFGMCFVFNVIVLVWFVQLKHPVSCVFLCVWCVMCLRPCVCVCVWICVHHLTHGKSVAKHSYFGWGMWRVGKLRVSDETSVDDYLRGKIVGTPAINYRQSRKRLQSMCAIIQWTGTLFERLDSWTNMRVSGWF